MKKYNSTVKKKKKKKRKKEEYISNRNIENIEKIDSVTQKTTGKN